MSTEIKEPRGILRGGWLDGRLIRYDDKEELLALGPGLLPPEGHVFIATSGATLVGKVDMVKYRRTDQEEDGLVVYEFAGEHAG